MKKIVDYDLITHTSSSIFECLVKESINNGWQPFGRAFQVTNAKLSNGSGVASDALTQVMVKYEKDPILAPISLLIFFMMSVVFMVHDLHSINKNVERISSYVERSATK